MNEKNRFNNTSAGQERKSIHPEAEDSTNGISFPDSTISEAFRILAEAGQPLSPETMWIENLYINPDCLALFSDKEGYLAFVHTVMEERFNVSLPDHPEPFRDMAADCSELYGLTAASSYSNNLWTADIRRLFETLKTPYYYLYARILKLFRKHFRDQTICDRCLKDFYSIIIKSSPEKLSLIDRLADQIAIYKKYSFLSEDLIYNIMIHHLALFALEKSGWLDELAFHITPLASDYPEETFPGPANTDSSNGLSHPNSAGGPNKTTSLNGLSGLSGPNVSALHTPHGEKQLLEMYLTNEISFLNNFVIEGSGSHPQNLSDYLTALSAWTMKKTLSGIDDSRPGSSVRIKEETYNKNIKGYGYYRNSGGSSSDFLDQYAYNMNLRKYISNPAIGREQELADLELILISPKKSPILIGEAGVGKTSVVEGLAYLMQRGDVPELLGDKTIYKLTTTSLLSGTKYVGEMEERMKALTDELMKHPEILLFIDEIHTIVGAGSTVSSHNDISNMLKPFIDRGDIKIIGATTREEYEHFLLPDRALARRFYPIQIEEPDWDMTMKILLGTIPSIEHETKVHSSLPEREMKQLLESLIRISSVENQPENQLTRLPELPLSILEMAYSYAALHRRNYLEKEDFVRAVKHSNRLRKDIRTAYKGI